MQEYFRNNCEMTHFFFSLIREPTDEDKNLPLIFYFDTHIITQVMVNVKHTFYDKVWWRNILFILLKWIIAFFNWWNTWTVLWSFCHLNPGAVLLLLHLLEKICFFKRERWKIWEADSKHNSTHLIIVFCHSWINHPLLYSVSVVLLKYLEYSHTLGPCSMTEHVSCNTEHPAPLLQSMII